MYFCFIKLLFYCLTSGAITKTDTTPVLCGTGINNPVTSNMLQSSVKLPVSHYFVLISTDGINNNAKTVKMCAAIGQRLELLAAGLVVMYLNLKIRLGFFTNLPSIPGKPNWKLVLGNVLSSKGNWHGIDHTICWVPVGL